MSQGNNQKAAEAAVVPGEEHEIDRIMKEIEELEKKVDEPTQSNVARNENISSSAQNTVENSNADFKGNVIPLRESMIETDAVLASNEPLFKPTQSTAQGSLGLKINGCTEVSLEFEKAGMTVSFQCTDSGLTITTDQGAEFKIPFTTAKAA